MSNSGLQSSSSDSRKSDSRNSDSRNAEMDQAIVEYMQACETGQFPDKQALLKNTRASPTSFAPGRDASRYNGSARYVNRPVYDNYGRVVGQERGTEWYNPSTGQVHGNKQVYTPNGSGGPTRRQCCTQRLAATSLR